MTQPKVDKTNSNCGKNALIKPKTNKWVEKWSPKDIGGNDTKKDFIARCHVEVSAGGFLRFPMPGDKKGRNWLDERLMGKFVDKLKTQTQQETLEWCLKEAKKLKTNKTKGGFSDCGEHNGLAECCRNVTIDDVVKTIKQRMEEKK